MKTKSSTSQNYIDANEEIKALKVQISRLEKELDNATIKAELYNEMINVVFTLLYKQVQYAQKPIIFIVGHRIVEYAVQVSCSQLFGLWY